MSQHDFSEKSYSLDDLLGRAGEHNVPLVNDGEPIVADEATQALWKEADEIWELCEDRRAFRSYVSADYVEVYKALVGLRGRLTLSLIHN